MSEWVTTGRTRVRRQDREVYNLHKLCCTIHAEGMKGKPWTEEEGAQAHSMAATGTGIDMGYGGEKREHGEHTQTYIYLVYCIVHTWNAATPKMWLSFPPDCGETRGRVGRDGAGVGCPSRRVVCCGEGSSRILPQQQALASFSCARSRRDMGRPAI